MSDLDASPIDAIEPRDSPSCPWCAMYHPDHTPEECDDNPDGSDELFDPALAQTVVTRLEQLRRLQAGWMDDDGDKVSEEVLDYVRQIVRRLDGASLRNLRIFPRMDGGVRFEWQRFSTEFSMNFLTGRTVIYDEFNSDTGSGTERKLSFDEARDIQVLLIGG